MRALSKRPHSSLVVELNYQRAINVSGIWQFCLELRHFAGFLVATKLNPIAALYFYVNFIKCLQVIHMVEKIKFRNLVVFADMQQLDNSLVQYFSRQGVVTATMQHGLYIDTSKDSNKMNINSINFLNIVSEYFLSWGKETKCLVEKFSRAKVIIVGKCLELFPSVASAQTKFITIFFDSDIFRHYNQVLLEIGLALAKEREWKIKIRFHPNNDPSAYNVLSDFKVNDDIEFWRAEFGIGHVTSMLFETLRCGLLVYKLRSPIPSHNVPDDLLFSDLDDLRSKIGKDFSPSIIAKPYIEYIDQESVDRYAQFYQSLLE